jgi:2-polyprenyl-6-methoxyphenol hydroxylase-like FAD-dependent oxidoreductase
VAGPDRGAAGRAGLRGPRRGDSPPQLTPLLADALLATGNAEIRWSSPVRRVRQDADGVDLDEVHADYVIAADGAHSTVRRELGLSFDGVEYPTFALRVITSTELDRLIPGLSPMTYIRDERQSCSLLGLPDHWRVILRLPHSTSPESAVTAVPDLLARALPGVADRIEVRDAHVYRTSRRVLESYRDGRVLFVGDAAHLTSTAGGMNMNCGVHDAVDIAEAVASVLAGGDTRRLDEAAARRRAVVTDLVIPRSEARVSGVDGKAGAGVAAAVASIAATAADPVRARGFLVEASLLDASPRLIGAL